ncbi:LCP family protein [uncultured Dysosmobacter sp.]|uniref:LCP family protein n=1 Tax=uncultured Dysosmobacter sp. TaxID=2591384 RepID=UPI0026074C8A|nr:LCP family protein [uncultured Dysosmobacter sp.]
MSRTHRRQKRRNWSRTLLLLIFIAAALYAGVHCLFRAPEQKQDEAVPAQAVSSTPQDTPDASQPPSTHQVRKADFYTILVSGIDDGNGLNDTNILVAVDAANNSIYGVSIPRDSKTVWDGKSHKINAVYNAGGMEKLADVVSDQLGIPVDYTVLVDLHGFEALVDAINGVDFYIPIDMDYDDPYQDLSIHFPKGMRHLYGSDAMKVVRFRHNNDGTGYGSEDIGRMQTQQNFLKAVAKQTLTLSNVDKLDDFVKIFQKYVETDLTLGNLLWLGKEAVEIGAENVEFSTLPGNWKSPYIYLDQAETLALVNQHLNPYVEDRLPEDLNIPS